MSGTPSKEMQKAYKNNTLDYGFEFGNFFNYEKNPKKVCIQWVDNSNIFELIAENLSQALSIIDKIEKGKGHLNRAKYKYNIIGNIKDN